MSPCGLCNSGLVFFPLYSFHSALPHPSAKTSPVLMFLDSFLSSRLQRAELRGPPQRGGQVLRPGTANGTRCGGRAFADVTGPR